MKNKVYYLSLSRGLAGYYIKILAIDENVVRIYGVNYFHHNWCSVYQEADIKRFIDKGYKTIIINEDDPVVLNDSGYYE